MRKTCLIQGAPAGRPYTLLQDQTGSLSPYPDPRRRTNIPRECNGGVLSDAADFPLGSFHNARGLHKCLHAAFFKIRSRLIVGEKFFGFPFFILIPDVTVPCSLHAGDWFAHDSRFTGGDFRGVFHFVRRGFDRVPCERTHEFHASLLRLCSVVEEVCEAVLRMSLNQERSLCIVRKAYVGRGRVDRGIGPRREVVAHRIAVVPPFGDREPCAPCAALT